GCAARTLLGRFACRGLGRCRPLARRGSILCSGIRALGTLRQVLVYARRLWRVLHHFIARCLVLWARAGVAGLAGLIGLRLSCVGPLGLSPCAIARLAIQIVELRTIGLCSSNRAVRCARVNAR